jgi:hypothetical protein
MKRTIGVEVIQPANTPIDDRQETDSRLDNLTVPTEQKGLRSHPHWDCECAGPRGRIKHLDIATRVDSNCCGLGKRGNHKHSILHSFPPIRPTVEIVTTPIIDRNHTRVGGIAVNTPWSRPVPVNEKVFSNIATQGAAGRTILERSYEWLGHVHPTIVGPENVSLEVRVGNMGHGEIRLK